MEYIRQEWIHITEGFPEEGERVLLWQNNEKFPQFNILIGVYKDGGFRDLEDIGNFPYVKYWMALPEEP